MCCIAISYEFERKSIFSRKLRSSRRHRLSSSAHACRCLCRRLGWLGSPSKDLNFNRMRFTAHKTGAIIDVRVGVPPRSCHDTYPANSPQLLCRIVVTPSIPTHHVWSTSLPSTKTALEKKVYTTINNGRWSGIGTNAQVHRKNIQIQDTVFL